jgi:Protein of unknown function (DUF4231)
VLSFIPYFQVQCNHLFSKLSDRSDSNTWYDDKSPNILEYIEKRLKPSIEWYEKKAYDNMLRYHLFQIVIIIAGVAIPIVNVVPVPGSDSTTVKIISSILGGIIVGLTSILQLYKSQESWIIFRATVESLKNEYQLYSYLAGKYSDENITGSGSENKSKQRAELFVSTVESIMKSETTTYLQKRNEKASTM